MAKKEETISLIDTFSEFKELKNIDRTTMVSVLEESFRSVIAKMFGTDENYDVHWMLQPAAGWTIAEPKGVVLIISPWNYPVLLALEPM